VEIYKLLRTRLGTTQAQISALMRCRPVSVSVGRLMEFLNVLGQDVEVTVKPAARRKAGERYRARMTSGAIRAATGARYRCATSICAGGQSNPAARYIPLFDEAAGESA
jgi:hypothetical protein